MKQKFWTSQRFCRGGWVGKWRDRLAGKSRNAVLKRSCASWFWKKKGKWDRNSMETGGPPPRFSTLGLIISCYNQPPAPVCGCVGMYMCVRDKRRQEESSVFLLSWASQERTIYTLYIQKLAGWMHSCCNTKSRPTVAPCNLSDECKQHGTIWHTVQKGLPGSWTLSCFPSRAISFPEDGSRGSPPCQRGLAGIITELRAPVTAWGEKSKGSYWLLMVGQQ